MTLPLCASRCARAGSALLGPRTFADELDRAQADSTPWSDDAPDDDEWEEFDPTPVEEWILDDFEWDIEEPWPDHGDYWDDSLDGEWDTAKQMTNDQVRHGGSAGGTTPMTKKSGCPLVIGHWDLVIGHSNSGGRHVI